MIRKKLLLSLAAASAIWLGSGSEARAQESASLASGRWELLPEGELPTQRHEGAYVRIGDLFYLVGGRGNRAVEIFDPATGSWRSGSPPPMQLHHFQAVEYDGKVYVVGAMTGGYPAEPPVPSMYIYDPATDLWSAGPAIPEGRHRGGAGVVVHEGLIYLISGIRNGHTDGHVPWVDVFDPRTGNWRQLADAPHSRDHFQAAVIGGRIYAAGGRRSSYATGQTFELTVPEVDVYDLATGRWSTLPPTSNIPTPRAGASVVVLQSRLVVIGGESGAQVAGHSEVEALDPATGRWTTLAPLQVGRHATQAIVHEGAIYTAAGSRTRGATEIKSQEVFRPTGR
jgi:N-acetylneuraminic acid mutarotase